MFQNQPGYCPPVVEQAEIACQRRYSMFRARGTPGPRLRRRWFRSLTSLHNNFPPSSKLGGPRFRSSSGSSQGVSRSLPLQYGCIHMIIQSNTTSSVITRPGLHRRQSFPSRHDVLQSRRSCRTLCETPIRSCHDGIPRRCRV
jgi:hypothetical protein